MAESVPAIMGPWLRFGVGLALTLVLSLICMRWVAPLGWMDHPRGRRQHGTPTPRTGGIALLVAIGLGHAFGLLQLPLPPACWGVVYGMGLMGILDDRWDIRARWKAAVSLVAALLLAWMTWEFLREASPHVPLLMGHLATKTGLAFALLGAWYWAAPQACNLIDGMNGLALGFFLMLALAMDFPLGPDAYGAYLVGALVALVVLNWPSGLQFLGDSGSLALGTLFAILGVRLVGTHNPNHLIWAFAYPIADVLMVMAIRLTNRRPIGEGDRSHFHHQWQSVLHSRTQISLVMTLLPAAACMQMLQNYRGHEFVAWAGACWLFAVGTWFYLRGTGFVVRREGVPDLFEASSGSIVELKVRERLPDVASGERLAYGREKRPDPSS